MWDSPSWAARSLCWPGCVSSGCWGLCAAFPLLPRAYSSLLAGHPRGRGQVSLCCTLTPVSHEGPVSGPARLLSCCCCHAGVGSPTGSVCACAGPAWDPTGYFFCYLYFKNFIYLYCRSNPGLRRVSLLKIMERSFRGEPQNRAHQYVFSPFLISGLGKKEVRLNKCGILLRSTVLCCSDLCWIVLSQQIWRGAGQVKALRGRVPSVSKELSLSLGVHPRMPVEAVQNMKVSVFPQRFWDTWVSIHLYSSSVWRAQAY